jgi:hypothetical protein
MSNLTEEDVLKLINREVYSTLQVNHLTDLTLSEKLATIIKKEFGRLNTDSFGTPWYQEPSKVDLILTKSIAKNSIKNFQTIRQYYTIVTIDNKKYITSRTVNIVVASFGFSNSFNINNLNTTNRTTTILPSGTIPNTTDFNTSGLLTRFPPEAWAYYVYWKRGLTGSNSLPISDPTGTISGTTSTGTHPIVENSKSMIMTIDNLNNADPNKKVSDLTPQYINVLKDYTPIQIINNEIVDKYIQENGSLDQLDEEKYQTILEELISQAEPTLDIVMGVSTISTWNGNSEYTTDNLAFYNPLLTYSLTEQFGYSSNGQGDGYSITCSNSSRTNINATSGIVGTIKESPFTFSGLDGYLLCKGLKNIDASWNSSVISSLPISAAMPPVITSVRYVGGTLAEGLIQQGTSLPISANQDDIFINTSDRKIYRYSGTEWVSIGGNDIFKELGENTAYTERSIAIGKTEFTPDISYTLDVSGLVNLNNQIQFTTATDISINSNFSISGDLLVRGNYVIQGTTSSTNNINVNSNTIVINDGVEESIYNYEELPLKSGIIINRAKEDEDTPSEPFKIVYTDDRNINDEFLMTGISGDLHRIATIDASKNYHNNEFVLWDANIGILRPSPMISISNDIFILDSSLQVIGNLVDISNNKYISGGVVSNNEELPETARENQIFINTTDRKIYRYTGTEWVSVGGNDIFKEVGDERTYTERSVAIGKTEFTPDISYSLDVSGLINLNNQIITSTTDISLLSNVEISGNLSIKGSLKLTSTIFDVTDNLYITGGKIGIGTNTIATNSESLFVNQTVENANTCITINAVSGFTGMLTFRESNISRWIIGNSPNTFGGIPISDISNNRNTLVFASRPTTTDQGLTSTTLSLTSESIRDRAQVVFTQDGRVGIGTFDPSAKLDITGNVKTRGDIYTPSFEEPFSSVFPHQDENKDIGLWGILNKMFDQPPKFKENGTISKSTNFVVKWEKAFSSLKFSHDGLEVPHISRIGIDISNGLWNVVDQNIDNSVRQYTFFTNSTYGGVQIILDEVYDIRVYGINQSNSTTYNYLLFESMAVVPPREPSEPRNVSFVTTDVSFTYINVKYDAPTTFNLDIEGGEEDSNTPALEHYKIVYKPEGENDASFNTLRNSGISDLCQNEITFLATTNLDYDASNIITQILHNNQSNPIYPASRYVLKEIRAKNILNNAYSDNGVVGDIVITTPPPPINYGGTIFSSFSVGGVNISEVVAATRIPLQVGTTRTFNIGNNKVDAYYVNITNITPTVSFTPSTNTSDIYINRHINKLGTNYRGRQRDTYVQLYYNTSGTDVSYQTLYYNGFNESGDSFSLNTGSIDICNNETQQDIDICFNQTSVITSTIPAGFGIYRGYGINGSFGISFLPNSIGIGKRFAPKTGIQKIGYKVKSFTVDTKREISFYVDNLEGFPSVTDITVLFNPKGVRYCYGVPSLEKFDVSCTYTVSNYAKYYLPPNGRYSKIDLINGDFVTTTAVDKYTTDISTSIITTHIFTDRYIINNFTNVKPTFTNTLRITPYNLNALNPTSSINLDITYNNGIHVDVSSYNSNIPDSTIKTFGSSEIYKYNNSSPYELQLLEDISNSLFVLPDNQMIFYRGAFRSGNTDGFPFANYMFDYGGEGRNYVSLLYTGDTVGTTTYKWVTKKVATDIPTHEETTRERTLTVNGSSNLPTLNDGNILVFVLQKYSDPDNTISTYGSTQNYTVWYNALKDFNGNATTNVVKYDTHSLSDDLGIRKINGNGKLILYFEGDVNKKWDIYVRIGLPINSTFAITSIGFS